ncbi:acyl-CoA dehydrogenase family protein [Paraburkholderia elongata]|uniref:Acyl-CoA dehydrogenase n=1 Tax=Paraburkholderia elongata TaxID=2675747 RepID=A0A972NJ41_9BURK|nr:acyl-CoA dehydrogenase [Paraburkholderia elongata]NPT53911.1 acyl-CoA dehydrogenase [Paraburkholderia elongata]
MNFDLSGEQQMLQDSVQRFVQKDYTFKHRRKLVAHGNGFSRDMWRTFGEMGWLGVAVPEAFGGPGFTPVESALIAEQLGRALVLEPYVMCGVFPTALVTRSASGKQRDALLAEIISGETVIAVAHSEREARGVVSHVAATARLMADGAWRLDGHKTLVVGAPAADRLIVVARVAGGVRDDSGLALFIVDPRAPGVTLEPYRLLDGTPAADLLLANVSVDATAVLGTPGSVLAGLQAAVDEAIVASCAELVGDIDDTVDLTAEYLKTRKQFGVPIGSFQALQHRIADMAIDAMQARATLHRALRALTADGETRSVEVSGCKAQTIRSGKFVTQQGIQLHGGYGITDEYKVGHHYRRMLIVDVLFGNMEYHLNRYARRIQEEARTLVA